MPKKIDDEQIFRAAIQAVIAKGYAGATTRQMARMAGVSEVTLFRRYGSKAALVCRALQAIAEEMDFEAVVRYTGDVQADLVRIVERYQRLVALYGPFFAALLPEIQHHSELQPLLARPWGVWQRVAAFCAVTRRKACCSKNRRGMRWLGCWGIGLCGLVAGNGSRGGADERCGREGAAFPLWAAQAVGQRHFV